MIEYVRKKYGEKSVAQIITFGTLGAKMAIRDVGRVMGLSYGEADRLTKMIPFDPKMTLEKALVDSPDFKRAYDEVMNFYIAPMAPKDLALAALRRLSTLDAALSVADEGDDVVLREKETVVARVPQAGARDAGRLRLEGKDYVVADGDVMHFRFAT